MKFIEAEHYKKTNGRNIRLFVMHSMEAPEKGTTAEAVANYFARGTVKASAHYCFDNDSEVQCVLDKDVAYAAPGANHDGIQFELAGYAAQSQAQWTDPFSLSMLTRAAIVAYHKTVEHNIPVVSLNKNDVAAGKKGFTTHRIISDTYHLSDHTDPGPNFPMVQFLNLIKAVPLLTQPKDRVVIMNAAISGRLCPVDGGNQKLQADGGVFNSGGCNHYFGSWLEPDQLVHHAPGRDPVALMDSYIGPEHYAILMKDGTVYDY